MAGANAIGTGALILTASSDKLGPALNAAESKIGKFAGSADKAVGSRFGRFLDAVGSRFGGLVGIARGVFDRVTGLAGGMVGRVKGLFSKIGGLAGGAIKGLLAGGAIGAGFGLATKGIEGLLKLPELIDKVKDKAKGGETGALDGILRGFERLSDAAERLFVRGLVAAAPAFTRVADLLLGFLDRMSPAIDKASARFEVFAFVAAELFGVGLDLLGDLIDTVDEWAASILGTANTTDGAGDQMFKVLRIVGKGFAYVWDTVKAGAGVVSWVAGKITQALGWVVKKLAEVIEFAARLADALPDKIKARIGLDGWGRAAEVVKGFGADVQNVGKDMEAWGEKQIAAWGQSVGRVEEWFNGVEQRFRDRKAALDREVKLEQPKLAGAAMKNTAESYSIVAKFNAGNTMAATDTKRQIQLLQQAVKQLTELVQLERAKPAVGIL